MGRRRGERRRRLRVELADARSGRVVFVSHCLLNQNTRYLGGAGRPGPVEDVIRPFVDEGVGIVQLPCPEQRVWGGVLKPYFLWLVEHPRAAGLARRVLAVATPYLRLRYRRLARAAARDVHDYVRNGFEVVGVVGVAGSPSCGAGTTLDLAAALAAMGARGDQAVTRAWMNETVVTSAERPGRGLFVEELTAALARRGDVVPVLEHEVVLTPRAR